MQLPPTAILVELTSWSGWQGCSWEQLRSFQQPTSVLISPLNWANVIVRSQLPSSPKSVQPLSCVGPSKHTHLRHANCSLRGAFTMSKRNAILGDHEVDRHKAICNIPGQGLTTQGPGWTRWECLLEHLNLEILAIAPPWSFNIHNLAPSFWTKCLQSFVHFVSNVIEDVQGQGQWSWGRASSPSYQMTGKSSELHRTKFSQATFKHHWTESKGIFTTSSSLTG